MPLLNYTTKIEAIKTAGEIQGILAAHGAKAILIEYESNGVVSALSFKVQTPYGEVGIRLPCDAVAVMRVLQRQKVRNINYSQATRIAWRIVKDWVEAQMAILETEMVRMEQIFLPYVITPSGRTLYDTMLETQFQLPEGEREVKE